MYKKSVNNEKIYPLYIIGNHDTYHDSSFIPEPDAENTVDDVQEANR